MVKFCFLKKKKITCYLFLAALGFHCFAWAFSSCSERGLLSVAVRGLLVAVASLVVENKHYTLGFQKLQPTGSAVWRTGLAAPRHAGSSRTWDWTCVPCTGRRILYYWATREALNSIFFKKESSCQNRRHEFYPWSGKISHASDQLSLWTTTAERALWSLWVTTTEPACSNYWSLSTLQPMLCNEKPPQQEACVLKLESSPAHCN